ncbi:uncharacterized protein LOC108912599 [Anoplophora glabripennis]|uniref:uncharacterized protein LOC108912599 n=1 Tax=Anoplophora glabripennis TaxID=217634 RepID=UPI000873DCFE|nr:uncharacterized protein LOC108912599 [Anoplophora glabripennis]
MMQLMVNEPRNLQETQLRRRRLLRYHTGYVRPWIEATADQEIFFEDVGSLVRSSAEGFHLILDIQQFMTNANITVRVIKPNAFTVEAEYQENEGTHGAVYRQMIRRYVVSNKCNLATLRTVITKDRVLIVNIWKTEIRRKAMPRIVQPDLLPEDFRMILDELNQGKLT